MKTKQYNRLPAKIANKLKSLPLSDFQEAEKNAKWRYNNYKRLSELDYSK